MEVKALTGNVSTSATVDGEKELFEYSYIILTGVAESAQELALTIEQVIEETPYTLDKIAQILNTGFQVAASRSARDRILAELSKEGKIEHAATATGAKVKEYTDLDSVIV